MAGIYNFKALRENSSRFIIIIGVKRLLVSHFVKFSFLYFLVTFVLV